MWRHFPIHAWEIFIELCWLKKAIKRINRNVHQWVNRKICLINTCCQILPNHWKGKKKVDLYVFKTHTYKYIIYTFFWWSEWWNYCLIIKEVVNWWAFIDYISPLFLAKHCSKYPGPSGQLNPIWRDLVLLFHPDFLDTVLCLLWGLGVFPDIRF